MLSGFGLQKIGVSAVRFPVLATLLVVLATALAGFGITRLGISGDNIEILRDGSKEMADYDRLLKSFRNFNNDSVVLVRADNLATVDGIENFRDLHFEFSLDERVESVLSLFSLVQFDSAGGGWKSAVPASFESDEQVARFLSDFAESTPSARSLMGTDLKSAVIVVYAENAALDDDRIGETMQAFSDLAADFASAGTSISIAGQPAIRADLVSSIVGDLLYLVPIALFVCGAISLLLFWHPVPVVLCALPSLFTVVWFLGGAGLTGTDLNFLTNVLPVLLIVIIFADTLHLYLKFQRLRLEGQDDDMALHAAIEQIGPACAISSLTTAAALLSFCFTGNFGLFELGVMGAIAVLAGFLGVIVVLPLGCYWAIRTGLLPKPRPSKNLALFAKPAIAALRYRGVVLGAGLVLTAIGLLGHWTIESSFRMLDYLSSSSKVAESEGYIDERFAGTTPMFVTVKLPDGAALLSDANTKLFDEVLEAVGKVFPSGSFYSLDDLASEIEKGGGEVKESDIDTMPGYLTNRFIAEDKSEVLVTIFSSANLSAKALRGKIRDLEETLAAAGHPGATAVTGYPVLASVVAPRLMDNLRLGLLLAVAFSIAIISLATRSLKLGLLCFIPNLLPILCVELLLIVAGIPLNMSIAVALTVAFGIAVDDSVHLLNEYLSKRAQMDKEQAISSALEEIIPAIFSTTIILSGGMAIMMFSSLYAISVFSGVVIITLVFAFLCDIFQLPEYLHKFGR